MDENFDYKKAVEELEAIATRVEDPNTGIDDIDKDIKRSKELIQLCREYLRSAGEKVASLEGPGSSQPDFPKTGFSQPTQSQFNQPQAVSLDEEDDPLPF